MLCSSSVTSREDRRAAASTASASSGLSVCMLSTPAAMPSLANSSAARTAVSSMPPVEMMVASVPLRTVMALPSVQASGSWWTLVSPARPRRR